MKAQLAALLCATFFGCSNSVDNREVSDSQPTLDVGPETVDVIRPDDRFADSDAFDSALVDAPSSDARDAKLDVTTSDTPDVTADDRTDSVTDLATEVRIRPPTPRDCCSMGVELGGCWTVGGSLVGGVCVRLCDGPPTSVEVFCWDFRGCPLIHAGNTFCEYYK